VAAFLWNQWQLSPGIDGRLAMESVAALPWNQWQASPGIGGMFGVEYAHLEAFHPDRLPKHYPDSLRGHNWTTVPPFNHASQKQHE
jgi:hypothetical protein